jgi:DNA-binding CsgD family transcriptional regulator
MCPFIVLKFVLSSRNNKTAGRSAKSYRELSRKIQVHHNTVKKYLTKMEVRRKAKKNPHLKPQLVNNPSSKLG